MYHVIIQILSKVHLGNKIEDMLGRNQRILEEKFKFSFLKRFCLIFLNIRFRKMKEIIIF